MYGLPLKLCAEELFVALQNRWINVVVVPTSTPAPVKWPGLDSIVDPIVEKRELAQVAVPCPKLRGEVTAAEQPDGNGEAKCEASPSGVAKDANGDGDVKQEGGAAGAAQDADASVEAAGEGTVSVPPVAAADAGATDEAKDDGTVAAPEDAKAMDTAEENGAAAAKAEDPKAMDTAEENGAAAAKAEDAKAAEDGEDVDWKKMILDHLAGIAPDCCSSLLMKRCEVFYDLHLQGYHLTSGLKFGSHFLAYPGDPMIYHAQFMVYVVDEFQELCPLHIAATARCVHGPGSLRPPPPPSDRVARRLECNLTPPSQPRAQGLARGEEAPPVRVSVHRPPGPNRRGRRRAARDGEGRERDRGFLRRRRHPRGRRPAVRHGPGQVRHHRAGVREPHQGGEEEGVRRLSCKARAQHADRDA